MPIDNDPSRMFTDGVRYLVDLIGRIVNGIKDIAPLILGFGCQTTPLEAPMPPPSPPYVAPAVRAVMPAAAPVVEPGPVGKFTITFYYVVSEDEVFAKPVAIVANDNRPSDPELVSIVSARSPVTLYATNGVGSCDPISEVSREFAAQLALQGTGKLRDGRVVNIWGGCRCEQSPCFKVTAATWGTGGTGRPLQPFRTVAVDPKVVKLGSLLHIPMLEGMQMPGRPPYGGFVHDGCVVAEDVGGGIKGTQLDLFVGRKGWFLRDAASGGAHAWARHVPVFDGSRQCERTGRRVARKTGAI